MRKILKWTGIILGGLTGFIGITLVVIVSIAFARINRSYDVPVVAVAIPVNEAAVARGEHLVRAIAGCTDCYGEDLCGKLMVDDPATATLYAPNLTSGAGPAGAFFTGEDWGRAIRHGVGTDGKALLIMPSNAYLSMTDEDLGAILSYLQSMEPVDNQVPELRIGPMGYLMPLLEPLTLPAALIDHTASPTAVAPGVTVEYGSYLVDLGHCRSCHGEDLNGRPGLLGALPSPNLTPDGELAGWTEEDFIETIRTAITPGGHELREPMAGILVHFQKQTDGELTAIFLYLQSLPPMENGYE